MRRITVKTVLLALASAAFTAVASPSFAGTISDHFTGGALDPAWTITTSNVNKYKYTVAGSKVTFSDNDPVDPPRADPFNPSAIDVLVAGDNQGQVFLTRSLSSFTPSVASLPADFALTFDFGWDNSAGTSTLTSEPYLNAYGQILVKLLNASNGVVAAAGFRDGSGGVTPQTRVFIGGTTTETGNSPGASTGDQITITRDALGNISFGWSGPGAPAGPFPTGVNTDTVTQVQIEFAHFRFDNGSKLGELWADQIAISAAAIPEPASLALLAGGALLAPPARSIGGVIRLAPQLDDSARMNSRRPTSASAPPRRAFTLIELLVVISVVALLVAILLPVLQKARDSARQIVCMSQLHQVALAVGMYQNESREHLPPMSIMDRQPFWWYTTSASWLGDDGIASSATDAYQNMGANERYLNRYLGGPFTTGSKIPVAHCPGDNRFSVNDLGGPVFGTNSYGTWMGTSYATTYPSYNWTLEWFPGVNQLGYRGLRLREIKSPSRMITYGEWGGAYFGSHPSALYLWYDPNNWYFHGVTDTYNLMFVDGHVRFMLIPQAQPNANTPDYTFLPNL